ncbi:hypothetical protein GCM10017772_03670 [Promicromonospora soli]|uniref:Uncharacterized protein n=1 Tax=Promicromonospora soli TaxID=2035533 RepID=A0A919FH91_9MICO|nr:hypothetical protein GCM10017772_03670 [Promicromonospora soli]
MAGVECQVRVCAGHSSEAPLSEVCPPRQAVSQEFRCCPLVLLEAERLSSDGVHNSRVARELLRELVVRDRTRARSHVRGLARRGGLLVA